MVRKQVGSYILGRTLGEGSYAKVKYAQHVETGDAVAIKVLDKARLLSTHMATQVKREIEIMTCLHHPYIVDLREVFPTQDKIYMVMELVPGGELFDHVIAGGPLQENRARKLFQQLMDGVDCCHRQGICHRDIKLENVLLDAENPSNAKLSDFGLGALPHSERDDGLLRTSCGTPNYVAPEVLSRRGYDGFLADVWSLGVCLFVMVAGKLPFEEANLPLLFRKITKADYICPSWFSTGLVDVLSILLEPRPNKRASMARLRKHPWVREGYTFVDAYPPRSGPPVRPSLDLLTDSIDPVTLAGSPARGQGVSRRASVAGMNAFQLINAALDLSAMFERRSDVVHRHTRFTSKAPPDVLLDHLQDAVRHLKGITKRRDNHRLKMTVQGAKSPLTLTAEVLPVIPGVHMVEMTRASGDIHDFYQLYALLSKAVIPALAKASTSPQGSPGTANLSTASNTSVHAEACASAQVAGEPGLVNGATQGGSDAVQSTSRQTPARSASFTFTASPRQPAGGAEDAQDGERASVSQTESGESRPGMSEEIGGKESLPAESEVTSRLHGQHQSGSGYDAVGNVESLVGMLQTNDKG